MCVLFFEQYVHIVTILL